jgi:hypothetical protein
MNYFKHTNGEAFTLNSSDYIGFFHIIDSQAFTGKRNESDSVLLTPKSNIITKLFTEKYEINTNYSLIDKIYPYYTNSFDVLDKNGLDKLGNAVDANNILCFKNLILSNPTVYKFQENNGFYYGLSSNNESNPSTIPAKFNYRGNCEKFSRSTDWEPLDKIISGVISVNHLEDFKYLCTNGETNYTFSGNFTNRTPLKLEEVYKNIEYTAGSRGYEYPDFVYHIYQDFSNNKIIYVKSSTIEIHDATSFNDCPTTTLIDILPLKKSDITLVYWDNEKLKYTNPLLKWGEKYVIENPNNPDLIKFGYNYRTEVDKLGTVLTIKNKYSKDVYFDISLATYGIYDIVDIDISSIDDYIIIMHKNTNSIKISQFYPDNLAEIKHHDLKSLILSASKHKIKFSDYDSDVFITTNEYEHHTRYLSNPEYPSGRLDTCDLMYYSPKVWNKTLELWEYAIPRWNSDLNYSNIYYNLINCSTIRNNKMYMILQNVGRIYAMSQPMNDRFLTPIPLNLPKNFQNVECSGSSIGLQLNIILRNLIEDTLSILRNSENTFNIEEREVIFKKLEDYSLLIENMYINGNETINVLTMQRILVNIFELQKRILPTTSYVKPIISVNIEQPVDTSVVSIEEINGGILTTTVTTTVSTLSSVIGTTQTQTTNISSGEISISPPIPFIKAASFSNILEVDKTITTETWTSEITPYLALYPNKYNTNGYKSGYDSTLEYATSPISTGYSEVDAYSPELSQLVKYEVRNWGKNYAQEEGYAFWGDNVPIITAKYDHINQFISWDNKNPTITLVRGKTYTFDLNFKGVYQPMIFATNIYESDGSVTTNPEKFTYKAGVSVYGDKITNWPIPSNSFIGIQLMGESQSTLGTSNGILRINVQLSSPDKLYYISLNSSRQMFGEILIVDNII